jgi:hypothetical protein
LVGVNTLTSGAFMGAVRRETGRISVRVGERYTVVRIVVERGNLPFGDTRIDVDQPAIAACCDAERLGDELGSFGSDNAEIASAAEGARNRLQVPEPAIFRGDGHNPRYMRHITF